MKSEGKIQGTLFKNIHLETNQKNFVAPKYFYNKQNKGAPFRQRGMESKR